MSKQHTFIKKSPAVVEVILHCKFDWKKNMQKEKDLSTLHCTLLLLMHSCNFKMVKSHNQVKVMIIYSFQISEMHNFLWDVVKE